MFRTITANPLLAAQGKFVCLTQETGVGKDRKLRYVILDSTTLKAETFDSKDAFNEAVDAKVKAANKPAETDTAANMFDEQPPVVES